MDAEGVFGVHQTAPSDVITRTPTDALGTRFGKSEVIFRSVFGIDPFGRFRSLAGGEPIPWPNPQQLIAAARQLSVALHQPRLRYRRIGSAY